ncbi:MULTISPECIES: hypothetical protein [Hyphomicrobiales]|jgi:signal peptidase II|uniref:hypothetical protein n=1 Tax=Hyphomicrobiales TaxID=356 RepID=UPI001CBC9F99|nr:hypothetical protein [Oricola indica]
MLPAGKTPVIGMVFAVAAFVIDQTTKATVVANAEILSSGIPVIPGSISRPTATMA